MPAVYIYTARIGLRYIHSRTARRSSVVRRRTKHFARMRYIQAVTRVRDVARALLGEQKERRERKQCLYLSEEGSIFPTRDEGQRKSSASGTARTERIQFLSSWLCRKSKTTGRKGSVASPPHPASLARSAKLLLFAAFLVL